MENIKNLKLVGDNLDYVCFSHICNLNIIVFVSSEAVLGFHQARIVRKIGFK